MTVIFPPTDPRLITAAAALAGYAHGSVNQKRKYTNELYIVHPMEVAEIVASVTNDSEMIAAAWLHDVVEDTPFDFSCVEKFLLSYGGCERNSSMDGRAIRLRTHRAIQARRRKPGCTKAYRPRIPS